MRQSPSTATVDGDNGLGLVVGPKANEMALLPEWASVDTACTVVRLPGHQALLEEHLQVILLDVTEQPIERPTQD